MTPQHNALPGGWRAWRRNPAGLSWFAQALLLAVILSPTLAYVAVGEFDALAERLVEDVFADALAVLRHA